ncbi:response regulator transcription factor [Thermoflavimicrobium daqui]|uniref:DNA-binding response regulator n=1 Tax=Thermoflavimicrobium daqui TaxID=2137476 RepID=A0A364K568_9BACL|nr:response regulator transcription factor [Thermoflavimicrobium daqui]RAL24409.1 DNA-binding response regulator [Thermoflavimicrobium daqui]
MNDAKILLVDDDFDLLTLLLKAMRSEGFNHVYTATTGQKALEMISRVPFNLVVLDVMLPDGNGYEVCTEIRKKSHVPIFFLTARTTDLDQLTGYSVGADDYICKPFNPLIFVARVKAQLKRVRDNRLKRDEMTIYDFGRFSLDEQRGVLKVIGQEIACTAKEFKLLAFFCKHPNQIFSASHLYREVWGEESLGLENTVMVHIHSLRKKIEENPSQPRYLLNIRGLGYKLVPLENGR